VISEHPYEIGGYGATTCDSIRNNAVINNRESDYFRKRLPQS